MKSFEEVFNSIAGMSMEEIKSSSFDCKQLVENPLWITSAKIHALTLLTDVVNDDLDVIWPIIKYLAMYMATGIFIGQRMQGIPTDQLEELFKLEGPKES